VIRALAVALAALALLPATASAHALLNGTTPERGARLDAPPEQVTLRFSEPVEAEFGAVRVFDSSGQEVQTGRTFHPEDRSAEIAVRLRDGLGDDGYTVTYRVISADSHPISGGFVFVVGDAAAPSTTVGELLGDSETGSVTGTAFGVARAVQFGAIALGLGTALFALLCWIPGVTGRAQAAFSRRVRTLLLVAAAAGAVSAAAGVVFQGAVAAGTTFWDAPGAVDEVLGTRFGVVWATGFVVWLLVAALAARPKAAIVPLVALAALPALGGHASVQPPVALLLPMNVLHVLAMSAWLGGVAVLVVALRSATAQLDGEERTPLLATVVGRFSALAGVAVAVVLATGIVQGIVEVRTVPNLFDTAFGRAVLIKIVVFLGIVALGAFNRRRLLPALRRAAADGSSPGRTGLLLRRTLRAELLLGIAALAATGALAGYAPSIAESTGPYSTTADIGPARMEMTVDPARVGLNEMHVYLFDRRDGRQYDETEELTVTAELPEKDIDRIELEATKAGPGHYVMSGAALGVAGDWTIEIAARVSDFDEYRAEVQVPVR
jgi:copper transport protein